MYKYHQRNYNKPDLLNSSIYVIACVLVCLVIMFR
jgi:hypothetical protein